jgi:catechol 2,3-dioxygenase
MKPLSIHPQTMLGSIHLRVADLQAQTAFYRAIIGMELLSQDPSHAVLGAGGRPLLHLVAHLGARRAEMRAGLYHFCIGVKERLELGRLLSRLLDKGAMLDGLVDHRMAEAIYLKDPEGNGMELNWDRPREAWPEFQTMLRLGNGPLDTEGLLGLVEDAGPGNGSLPADAWLSHIHLHVGDLKACTEFYHGLLGFDVMGEFPRQAVFTSAGGYHHHIAYNIWHGAGAQPAPAGALGLDHFSIVLPSPAELQQEVDRLRQARWEVEESQDGFLVMDPSRNAILLRSK